MNRLHPRILAVWVLEVIISAIVVGLLVAVADRLVLGIGDALPATAAVVVLIFGIVYSVARYRVWTYEIREDAIYLERGVFTRVRTIVPFVRIQHVDTARSPVARFVGLANTVIYTAGSRGADVTVPGLTARGASDLQERLKRLAIRAEGEDAV